tara:strand:+ start:72 stop:728 length:657 start_codon:yes stop_codon:yes gene_type:complete
MKKRAIIAISLLLLLTTITSQQTIIITKLKLKQINIENNILVAEDELKKLLAPIYERNLIFLSYIEIERILMQNSFIESFEIKKIYPNTLKIRIFEKKPIAILVDKKKKYLLSDKIDLIDYQILKINKNLPMVVGKQKDFKILYSNLKNIDFPFDMISKYILFDSGRWDLVTKNKKIIKLPTKRYNRSLKNYVNNNNKRSFKNYKVFDYRIKGQLILK